MCVFSHIVAPARMCIGAYFQIGTYPNIHKQDNGYIYQCIFAQWTELR